MITLGIRDILETTRDGIRVVFSDNGRSAWLPRKEIDFLPHRVIVPMWLFNRFKRKNNGSPKT